MRVRYCPIKDKRQFLAAALFRIHCTLSSRASGKTFASRRREMRPTAIRDSPRFSNPIPLISLFQKAIRAIAYTQSVPKFTILTLRRIKEIEKFNFKKQKEKGNKSEAASRRKYSAEI